MRRRGTAVDLWDVETLRALPPDSRPTSAAVQFVGGMMDGKIKHLPTSVDDGPVPFNGYNQGRPVSHWYDLAGWRPDPDVWVYRLRTPLNHQLVHGEPALTAYPFRIPSMRVRRSPQASNAL